MNRSDDAEQEPSDTPKDADREAGIDGAPTSTPEHASASSGTSNDANREADTTNDADREAGRQLEPEWTSTKDDEKRSDKHFILASHPPSSPSQRARRHAAILGLLIVSSIWGALAREGLVALNTYSGMSVEPTVWAQAVGCLVMGWTIGNRQALERWYPPAYIMLSTGFCGSLTTFSSWILHAFQAYGNQRHYDRHGLHNVMDALTQTAVTLGMSLSALYAGQALSSVLPAHVALHHIERVSVHKALRQRHRRSGKETEINLNTSIPYTAVPDQLCILLGILFWAGAAVLCGTYAPYRHVTYTIVLSPPGAILRWYLSPLNSHARSKRAPYWPLGTLAANLLATAVIGGVFVGQRVGRVAGSPGASTIDGCHALYGVQEGFCGCLSTISTFAVELSTLRPRRAVSYAVGSYVLGIILCVLIIGAPWWSIGMDGSCVGIAL